MYAMLDTGLELDEWVVNTFTQQYTLQTLI